MSLRSCLSKVSNIKTLIRNNRKNITIDDIRRMEKVVAKAHTDIVIILQGDLK